MAKRCLIVSYYFPPTGGAGVQRVVKLIKYASRNDWRFTVITAKEHSEFQPKDHSLLTDFSDEVNIIRIKSALPAQKILLLNKTNIFRKPAYWKRWLGAFIQIPDSRKSWNRRVKKYIFAELDKNNYDCLMITAPPYSLSLLALEMQNILSIPVILDMRDPWSSHPYKLHPTSVHRSINRFVENRTLSRIVNGIHVSGLVLDDYMNKMDTFDRKRWTLIPNGYDEEDFIDVKKENLLDINKINIAFLGSIHANINSPEYLFKAIKYLKKREPDIGQKIHFHHIGQSAISIDTLSKKYNLKDQVTLWGYQSHKTALEILIGMDAFFQIHLPKYIGSKYIIGGKMYEYLRLKKPILAVVPKYGEVAAIINETNSGEIVDSVKSEDIASGLLKIINENKAYRFINIEKYSRENQADKFITVFENAISSKKI